MVPQLTQRHALTIAVFVWTIVLLPQLAVILSVLNKFRMRVNNFFRIQITDHTSNRRIITTFTVTKLLLTKIIFFSQLFLLSFIQATYCFISFGRHRFGMYYVKVLDWVEGWLNGLIKFSVGTISILRFRTFVPRNL